jgi:hypothetical protein
MLLRPIRSMTVRSRGTARFSSAQFMMYQILYLDCHRLRPYSCDPQSTDRGNWGGMKYMNPESTPDAL